MLLKVKGAGVIQSKVLDEHATADRGTVKGEGIRGKVTFVGEEGALGSREGHKPGVGPAFERHEVGRNVINHGSKERRVESVDYFDIIREEEGGSVADYGENIIYIEQKQ